MTYQFRWSFSDISTLETRDASVSADSIHELHDETMTYRWYSGCADAADRSAYFRRRRKRP